MRNQKTVFWINLVVSIVLIAVGAFLVGFVGFNGDSTTSDTYVIEVRDMLRLTDDGARRAAGVLRGRARR